MGLLRNVKKGAQIVGKMAAHKIEEKGKAWWKGQIELRQFNAQLKTDRKTAYRDAYRKESMRQARKAGKAQARKPPVDSMQSITDLLLGTPEKKSKQ